MSRWISGSEPALGNALSRRSLLRGTGALAAATALGSVPLLSACGTDSGDAKQLSFWNFYGPGGDVPRLSRISWKLRWRSPT
ncbi:MAG: twin-arginine translocation signal domain-containing protein [Micromonosporaceae bacterium]